ncbi:hypothetical protein Bbelb_232740 [Branchiostoma belcheri]|nr:hypothetical protein Bbelb_232740 [Branchiostoma belcheri]
MGLCKSKVHVAKQVQLAEGDNKRANKHGPTDEKSHNMDKVADKRRSPATIVVQSRSQAGVDKAAAAASITSSPADPERLITSRHNAPCRNYGQVPVTVVRSSSPVNAFMAARDCCYSSNLALDR